MTSRAIAHYRSGNLAAAKPDIDAVLASDAGPRDKAVCWQLLGLIHHQAGRYADAAEQLQKAVALQPDVPELRQNLVDAQTALARQYRRGERLADAEKSVREGLRWQPLDPEAQCVLGVVLQEQDRLAEARACFEQAIKTSPQHARLRHNYANLLATLQEWDPAIEQFRAALNLRPDDVRSLLGAGATLLDARRSKAALQLLEKAVQLNGDNADARFNLGNAYVATHRMAAGAEQYEHALRIRPDWPSARANWIRHRCETCDWRDDWHEQLDLVRREIIQELDAGNPGPLHISASPALPIPRSTMRRMSVDHTERIGQQVARRGLRAKLPATPERTGRLRIGYFSPDFRHHAIGHLCRTMFAHHDRDKFEIFSYSTGPDDNSEYRERIMVDSDHFYDCHRHGDTQIIERMVSDGIDVLVDIGGYTAGGNPAVLMARPAPVTVHYLGFPGTMGGLVDYFVTDPVLTPLGSNLRDEFEEALIYLPDTYQMADDQQAIAEREFTREDCELPPTGFVFCAFNNNYKIQPEIFDVWMQILRAVPESVLWLLSVQPQVADNLRREAQQRDVDPDRLIFAKVVPKPDHLSRHRLADLYLDTPICNAHTSAADSVWAGVPLITCPGERMTERVAASILTAAGLEKLIVSSLDEYEQLAIKLAKKPSRLKKIREDWANRRTSSRMFDTAARVKQLEQAYEIIWQRHCRGEAPQDTVVSRNGE